MPNSWWGEGFLYRSILTDKWSRSNRILILQHHNWIMNLGNNHWWLLLISFKITGNWMLLIYPLWWMEVQYTAWCILVKKIEAICEQLSRSYHQFTANRGFCESCWLTHWNAISKNQPVQTIPNKRPDFFNKDTVKNKMRDREEIYIAWKTSKFYQTIVIYECYLNMIWNK